VFDTPTFQMVGLCKRQYYRIPSCAMRGARWLARANLEGHGEVQMEQPGLFEM
jgi:hypothetical protein